MDGPLRTTGFGSPAESYAEASVDWNKILFPKPHAMYSFRIAGTRLEPLGLNNRDVAVVDCSVTEITPGMLAVFISGGAFGVGRATTLDGSLAFDCAGSFRRLGEDFRIIGAVSRIIRFLRDDVKDREEDGHGRPG